MQVVAKSEKGLVRQLNEDRYLATDNLIAVADGMGGHLAGEVAAQIAVDKLAKITVGDNVFDSLKNVFLEANRTIFLGGKYNREQEGMGTTLTVVYTQNMKAYIAHVGDSRAYLIRNASVLQLTEDHSYVNQLVALGTLSQEEAQKHPQRNILLRVLGTNEDVKVDLDEIDLESGDRILVASDGLVADLQKEAIDSILLSKLSLEETVTKLLEAALEVGGRDNITIVLGEV